ncbi:glucose-6-phosphate/phosphate translocator 2, chloroplastic-like [Panicum miliaceum]|uniref:Glucose-6-phosphate/phosphate translocator 2, chloroplastic-like n=1 Tax=Panicum miliaceum TaxID=4540 RepID=A0A3L6RJA1_PANMI|nr:glucose-6-phosphate/phosphate translocator 2, chloroplastic-like [Panicum miliaceum]
MGTKTNPEARIEVFVFNLEIDRSALLNNSLVEACPGKCCNNAQFLLGYHLIKRSGRTRREDWRADDDPPVDDLLPLGECRRPPFEPLPLPSVSPNHVSVPAATTCRGRFLAAVTSDYTCAPHHLPSAADDKESKAEVVPVQSEGAQRLKISIYFATWWALNVIFNIYNKKVLNAFPYPWLTSTLSLACGSAMMLFSWATRLVEAPKTDLDFWKVLFPVAVAHTIGHVAATVSMSKVAVSFTHIIKSAEPAFSVLVSRFLLGETFPVPVYLSLLPVIGGCALAAVTELNFNMVGFMGAMISNLAFVFRNIFSKKGMKGKSVSGMNYYACLSIMSLVILTPFAIAMEGPQMWAAGWQKALAEVGPNVIWWVAAQSVFYHLYNQVSYMSLDQISPLTFSIGNTMKRISVIVSSIIIFHTPVRPVNALGAAIAILGTFLYSQLSGGCPNCIASVATAVAAMPQWIGLRLMLPVSVALHGQQLDKATFL